MHDNEVIISSVDINSWKVVITSTNTTKYLKTSDLGNIFGKTIKLNFGFLDPNIKYINFVNGKFHYIYLLPAAIRPIALYIDKQQVIKSLYIPQTLWLGETIAGETDTWKYNCYFTNIEKDEVINMDTETYHFPLGNVHSDGKICWGEVKNQIFNFPQDCHKPMNLFFSTQFNGDLCNSNFFRIIEVLEELKNNTDINDQEKANIIFEKLAVRTTTPDLQSSINAFKRAYNMEEF